MKALDVVQRYQAAFGSKDFKGARAALHDDLRFTGPIDEFDNADDLMTALEGLSQIVKGATPQHVFQDGDDVAVFYDLHTATDAGTVPVAEWFTVRDGRIGEMRVLFDPRPFAPPG